MSRFRPGQSGNPNGRPPGGTSVAEYIREKAGADGRRYVDLLDSIAMDEKQPTRVRVDAAKVLLTRGFGSAPQEVHVSAEASPTADELRTMLRENHPEVHQWLHGEEP